MEMPSQMQQEIYDVRHIHPHDSEIGSYTQSQFSVGRIKIKSPKIGSNTFGGVLFGKEQKYFG